MERPGAGPRPDERRVTSPGGANSVLRDPNHTYSDAMSAFRDLQERLGPVLELNVEGSTVELTTEMVQMMIVQRAYAANAQIVQAADQLMALANGLRR